MNLAYHWTAFPPTTCITLPGYTIKIKVPNQTYLYFLCYTRLLIVGNGLYGEHEIDYVLFMQQDVKLNPNPQEVSEISFIPRKEFDDFVPTLTGAWTPWFALILKHRLKFWWDRLDNLEEIKQQQKILRFKCE